MALFEGKNPTERNKMIAAAVLGLVALVALYFAFGRSFFGSTTTATTKKYADAKAECFAGSKSDRHFKLPTADGTEF